MNDARAIGGSYETQQWPVCVKVHHHHDRESDFRAPLRARVFVDAVRLLKTGLPIEWLAFIESHDGLEVRVSLRVRHRDTGAEVSVVSDAHIQWWVLERPDAQRIFIELVRNLLRQVLMHELDECFLFDGVRVSDPHANDASPVLP